MRLRLVSHLQRPQDDILRHSRLRLSRTHRGRRLRRQCRRVVRGRAGLRTAGGKSSFLQHFEKGNDEEDSRGTLFVSLVPAGIPSDDAGGRSEVRQEDPGQRPREKTDDRAGLEGPVS